MRRIKRRVRCIIGRIWGIEPVRASQFDRFGATAGVLNAVVQNALDPLVCDLAIRTTVMEFELFEPPGVWGSKEDFYRGGHKKWANDRRAHASALDPDGDQGNATAQGHECCPGTHGYPILFGPIDAAFGKHSHKAPLLSQRDRTFGRCGIDSSPVGRDALKESEQLTDQGDFEILPGDHPVDPIAGGQLDKARIDRGAMVGNEHRAAMSAGPEVGWSVARLGIEQVRSIGNEQSRGVPFAGRWFVSKDFSSPQVAGHEVDRPVEDAFPGGVLSGSQQQPGQYSAKSAQDQQKKI